MPVDPVPSTHDLLQASATAQMAEYADLSRSYAARGDGRLAQLAAWAADVQALQVLLWENGLAAAPDPDAQLAAVGGAVSGSLDDHTDAPHAPATIRESVERARDAMVAAFDESVHVMLAERFVPLDHLDALEVPGPEDARESRSRRLAGRTPDKLVTDLHQTAGDCMAVSAAMADEGDLTGATYQARQADLAAFEAYLVSAALASGDLALATVDLRWDLATAADRDVPLATDDPEGAVARFRDRLAAVVGPVEAPRLRASFEAFAPVRA
jgi:hypothetical protein